MSTAACWQIEIISESPGQTIELGRRLGTALEAGDVIALVGQLGAGKTLMTKGLALGLGVESDRIVNSPTFVLVNEYAGRVPIHHLDAYRLADATALLALGFEEMCSGHAAVIVEWADRARSIIPPNALWIEFETCMAGDPTEDDQASRRNIKMQTADMDLANRLNKIGLDRAA